MAKQPKLRYRFHNPNTAEATAEYIAKILVDVNRSKIEALLAEVAASQQSENHEDVAE